MPAYRFTVTLLVEAETRAHLADTVAETLRPLCEDFGGPFVTWEYAPGAPEAEAVILDREAYPVGASYDVPIHTLEP